MIFGGLNPEWRQIAAILTGALVALNTSLLNAWPSPSIPILTSSKNITMEEASYTIIIPSISSVLTSPLYPFLMDRFGRKSTLLSIAFPQFAAWLLLTQTTNLYLIYTSRFLSGLSNACLYSTLPIYIGEISTPKVRGLWGNAMSCLIYFGYCMMNVIGTYCSIEMTAYILSSLPVVFFASFCLIAPESPYYYLMHNDDENARRMLAQLRGDEKCIDSELELMRRGCIQRTNEVASILDLFKVKRNLRALFIIIGVRAAQQFAGITAFSAYAPYLFIHTNSAISSSTSTIIFTASLTLATLAGAFLLDKIGRRPAMIASCIGCACILFLESLYFYYIIGDHFILFPIVGMCLYVIFYSFGLGIIPNLLLGELFSSSVKGSALCVANIMFGLYASVSTKVFQILYTHYGIHAGFSLFGFCCVLSTVFSIFFIPETSGKTLEEIQCELSGEREPPITTTTTSTTI